MSDAITVEYAGRSFIEGPALPSGARDNVVSIATFSPYYPNGMLEFEVQQQLAEELGAEYITAEYADFLADQLGKGPFKVSKVSGYWRIVDLDQILLR